MYSSILEQSISLTVLLTTFWKVAGNDDTSKMVFEIICNELVELTGDDELEEELNFLVEVNFWK